MKSITIKSLLVCFFSLSFLVLITSQDTSGMIDEKIELPASVITIYQGSLTYTNSTGTVITVLDGTAEIKQTGNTYTIKFSNRVPSLEDLNFENDDGAYATISGSSSVSGIVIDEDDLDIGVSRGGSFWAFSGSK